MINKVEKIVKTVTDTLIEVNEVVPDGENAVLKPLDPVVIKSTRVAGPSALRYAQKAYPKKNLLIGKINHTSEVYEMDIDTFMRYATKKEM